MSGCCKKPKNPCMVCNRTVTNKTGLQCQGSCKAWIHYACCSYTPGKIKDIKAKIIKVRCPCPDCSPLVPKEEIVLKKENSFSCVNEKCPVNNPAKCNNKKCPVNAMSQMPSCCQSQKKKEWPTVKCGTACKKNSATNLRSNNMGDRPSPPPGFPPQSAFPPPSCPQSPCPPPASAKGSPRGMPPPCSPPPCPPPPCSPPPVCPTQPVMPSISVVENMCETVGLLSNQLNQLMCKMTNVLSPKPSHRSKGHGSPGNPCYCPQNPKRT